MGTTIPLELELSHQTYLALKQAAARAHKSEAEIALDAIAAYLSNLTQIDSLLGLFADDPELIDQIEKDVMQTREKATLRVNEV